MTLALNRTLPHFDVLPNLLSETCLIYGCEGSTYVAVTAVDGDLRHVWWCVPCSSQYTTRYVPVACPDGLPWCVNHQTPPGMHQAVVDYFNTDSEAVTVGAGIAFDEAHVSLRVRLGAACWSDWQDLGAGVGMSAEHARQLGRRLVDLADQADGGRS